VQECDGVSRKCGRSVTGVSRKWGRSVRESAGRGVGVRRGQ